MSTELFETESVMVTRYAGKDGPRIQIDSLETGEYVTMALPAWNSLVEWLWRVKDSPG